MSHNDQPKRQVQKVDYASMTDEQLRSHLKAGEGVYHERLEKRGLSGEEIKERLRTRLEVSFCMARQISECCHAPWDTSHIVKEGRHKGHGGYFCSACHKCLFWV